jgi:hypothetical protein
LPGVHPGKLRGVVHYCRHRPDEGLASGRSGDEPGLSVLFLRRLDAFD